MILSISFSSKIAQYPPPLGIECVTLVPHADDSGSTVAGGQHYPMPLWSQNHDSFFPHGKNYATPSKIQIVAPHHGAISIVTCRVPSPRNNAVTRGNKTPSPFPRPLPTRPVPMRASVRCVSCLRLHALPRKNLLLFFASLRAQYPTVAQPLPIIREPIASTETSDTS